MHHSSSHNIVFNNNKEVNEFIDNNIIKERKKIKNKENINTWLEEIQFPIISTFTTHPIYIKYIIQKDITNMSNMSYMSYMSDISYMSDMSKMSDMLDILDVKYMLCNICLTFLMLHMQII